MSDEPNLQAADTEGATDTATTEDQTLLGGDDGASVEETSDVADTDNTEVADADTDGEGNDEQAGDADQTVPETYADFDLPEGIELDSAMLESATPLFKELGLSQDNAQKLVNFQADQVKAQAQAQADAFEQLKNDWKTQSTSDKEIGGDAFKENLSHARAALDKFGTPELSELMESYGIGNNPEMIRFMMKVGKLTQEDVPDGGGNAISAAGDRVSQLYPSG